MLESLRCCASRQLLPVVFSFFLGCLLVLFSPLTLRADAQAATEKTYYYVSPQGSDGNPGTKDAPWKTLQYAADHAPVNSVVRVLKGEYAGFVIDDKGRHFGGTDIIGDKDQPFLTFMPEPGVMPHDIIVHGMADGSCVTVGKSDSIVISGMTLQGCSRGFVNTGGTNTTVRNVILADRQERMDCVIYITPSNVINCDGSPIQLPQETPPPPPPPPPAPTPAPSPPPPPAPAQTACKIPTHADYVLREDFENGNLDEFSKDGRCCEDAARIAEGGRDGGKAVKVTLDASDTGTIYGKTGPASRAELPKWNTGKLGDEVWYSRSIKIDPSWHDPSSSPNCTRVSGWGSLPDAGEHGQPANLSINVCGEHGDQWRIGNISDAAPISQCVKVPAGQQTCQRRQWDIGPVEKDTWTDFVVRAKWSDGADGILQIWMNGKLVVDYHGPNAYNNEKPIFNQTGIYNSWWTNHRPDEGTLTAYFDNVNIAKASGSDGYAAVAPECKQQAGKPDPSGGATPPPPPSGSPRPPLPPLGGPSLPGIPGGPSLPTFGKCEFVKDAGKQPTDSPEISVSGTVYRVYDSCSEGPLCTLAQVNALNLKPGDAVLFEAGGTWHLKSASDRLQAKSGVTYSRFGSGPNPVLDGAGTRLGTFQGLIDVANKSNVVIDGIDVKNWGDSAFGVSSMESSNVTIRNLKAGPNKGGGGIISTRSTNVTVDNVEVAHVTGGPHESIAMVETNGFVVRNSYSHDNGHAAINTKNGSKNGEIYGNVFTGSFNDPTFYIERAENINAHHNIIINTDPKGTHKSLVSIGIEPLGDGTSHTNKNISFHDNLVSNGHSSGVKLWIKDGAGGHASGPMMENIHVYNNTITGIQGPGIQVIDTRKSPQPSDWREILIENNLLWDIGGPSINITSGIQATVRNNLVQKGAKGDLGSNPVVTSNPGFMNPAGGDFRLKPDSPAIGAGFGGGDVGASGSKCSG